MQICSQEQSMISPAMYLNSKTDQNHWHESINESYIQLFQMLALTSKTLQISFEIHEDIWQHFPMPLIFLSKGIKNASIYTECVSDFGYK